MKFSFKPRNLPQITFDDTNMQGISDLHHDGLVITMQIGIARVLRILVDGGRSVNLIMLNVLKAMKIDEDQIIKKSNVLVGFSGETRNTLGEIYLSTYVEGVSSYEIFGVLDSLSSYNTILGRPWIHNVRAIPSTTTSGSKFQRNGGYNQRYVLVGSDAPDNVKTELVSFLKIKSTCFAWSHFDMTSINANVITHKLNIDTSFKPVQQKRRKFAPERNAIINEEVDKLLDMRMIREIMYPEWLANVVVVQKKNGKWRVCIDYTNLNKACPKDPFPLPHIDAMWLQWLDMNC
ncbi:uncharacterized protein LOC141630405 [Silene latifolia]|uniref:uncharacterized protein LOC141630405 n=1 Tax=Silene latifolia TaxID=37657 RepID=UPI003D76C756